MSSIRGTLYAPVIVASVSYAKIVGAIAFGEYALPIDLADIVLVVESGQLKGTTYAIDYFGFGGDEYVGYKRTW